MMIAIRDRHIAFNIYGPNYGIGHRDVGVSYEDCLTPYGLFIPLTAEDMTILPRLRKSILGIDFAHEGSVLGAVRKNGAGILVDEDGITTLVGEHGVSGASVLSFTPVSLKGVMTLVDEREGSPMENTAMRICVHLTKTLDEQLQMYAKYHPLVLENYPVQPIADIRDYVRERFDLILDLREIALRQLAHKARYMGDNRRIPQTWIYGLDGKTIPKLDRLFQESERIFMKRSENK